MRNTRLTGRIGGLTVALCIGVGLAAAPWAASATPADSDPSTKSDSPSSTAGKPSGGGPCSSRCGVGGFDNEPEYELDPLPNGEPYPDGQGATSSGGKANGAFFRGSYGRWSSTFAAGPLDAGHFVANLEEEQGQTGEEYVPIRGNPNEADGSFAGKFHDEESPEHLRGRTTGRSTGVFGDCTGVC